MSDTSKAMHDLLRKFEAEEGTVAEWAERLAATQTDLAQLTAQRTEESSRFAEERSARDRERTTWAGEDAAHATVVEGRQRAVAALEAQLGRLAAQRDELVALLKG